MAHDATTSHTSDLVPIADRLRYMQVFRVAVAVAVTAITFALPSMLAAPAASVRVATLAYVLVTGALYGVWLAGRRHALLLFATPLIVDGAYLAWTSWATGTQSPVRYLIVLQLIVVALLASYRTGLKLALWHSLMLMSAYYGQRAGLLDALTSDHARARVDRTQAFLFIGVFWFVAVVTSTFSAINERELRRRRYDLEALARMATSLEEARESLAVADILVDSLVDTFDFERVVVAAAPDGAPVLMAQRGAVPSVETPELCERSVIERARRERRTLLVAHLDAGADPWLAEVLPDARNLVVVPLFAEGEPLGVLVAEHSLRRGSRIERRVVSTVERFVSYGSLALGNAWLLERVERAAATDGLTGIANRSTFDAALERELDRAARHGEDLSLVMIDIDHFKSLNDRYGHLVGDAVLQGVARTLAVGSRSFDLPARYGGEEFAVVLPRTARGDAYGMAERLRRAVAETHDDPSVTVSAGVATFPLDGAVAKDLVRAADAALYASKRAGRDRVTAATPAFDAGLLGASQD
jgi:two-component system cell cycle response regulator